MKARSGMLFLLLIVVTALASACGSGSQADNANTANSGTSANTGGAANTGSTSDSPAAATVEIKLGAKDFEYDQKEIHVKKGDHVKITLTSDDGGHGFTIPDYNVNIQGNGSAEFDAKNAGTFEYHCSVMCGSGHTQMKGKLIVDEA